MRTLSSPKPAIEHKQFMRWASGEEMELHLVCTETVAETEPTVTPRLRFDVCWQERQHPGVVPGGRGARRPAHVVALQRRPHRHAG